MMPSIKKKSLTCATYGIKGSNYILLLVCSMLDKSFKFSLKLVVDIITLLPFEFLVPWYANIVITLSWDVHPHPGPLNVIDRGYSAGYFTFCNWNVNTLNKNDLHRVSLLESSNTLFSYGIISLCETSLNDSVPEPNNILNGYQHHACNHPSSDKKEEGEYSIRIAFLLKLGLTCPLMNVLLLNLNLYGKDFLYCFLSKSYS